MKWTTNIFYLSIFVLFILNISKIYAFHSQNSNSNNNLNKKSEISYKLNHKAHAHLQAESSEGNLRQISKHTRDFISNTMKKAKAKLVGFDVEKHEELRHFEQRRKVVHDYENPHNRKAKVVNLDGTYEGWLTLQSEALANSTTYPAIPDKEGIKAKLPLDTENRVVNKLWRKGDTIIPSKYFIFARLKGNYLYFSNDAKNLNMLTYLYLENVKDIQNLRDENYCFNIIERENKWQLCAVSQAKANKWVCLISSTIRKLNLEFECSEEKILANINTKIVERRIEQPFIIIPTPQEYCNVKWDYENEGKNWQCLCREGQEQSPIDLPKPSDAIDSPSKPIFDYKKVDKIHLDNSFDGKIRPNTPVKVEYDKEALRIHHENLGKLVTLDGTVYIAEEIVFHTPSEHTINGEKFPLEMQVIHRAATRGDYGKRAVLSFLFKGKAGVYNKFIDTLDFFSLPNPYTKSRNIFEKLFIPNILFNVDDIESGMMASFSFYTYQGSLSEPPCTEGVIHFVASEPLELSLTALEMFKEALREPDYEDAKGNIIQAKPKKLTNARATQSLNGRSVFHFDHIKYCFPTFKKPTTGVEFAPRGHYEKQEKSSTEYFFVEGQKPSGIPGAIIVPEEEAS